VSQDSRKAPGSKPAESLSEIAAPTTAPDPGFSLPIALLVSVLVTALLMAIPALSWLACGWLLATGWPR
jgi:hypothetical protein